MREMLKRSVALVFVVLMLAGCSPANQAANDDAPECTSGTTQNNQADTPGAGAETPQAISRGLPDGFQVEVAQTGERSGVLRITDPSLRTEYPFENSQYDKHRELYAWRIDIGDDFMLNLGISNYGFSFYDERTVIGTNELHLTLYAKAEDNHYNYD